MTEQNTEATQGDATEEIIAETTTEQNGNEEATQQEPERDYEAEAESMGWIPKERFKGDESRWTDAKTFVERGESFIPFIKADNAKLKAELQKSEAELAKRLQRMEAAQARREEALTKQYERRLADVKAAQAKAVRDGDEDEFRRLDAERDELQQEAIKPQTEDIKAVQAEWTAQNAWYNTDFDMAQTADQYSQFVARQSPGLSMADNLAKVDAHMREKFPDKFGIETPKPAPKPKQAVDGGSSFQASPFKKTANGFSALPAEAKAMFQRDVDDNLFENTDKDKEQWAKAYFNG
jgi:hypothetical protein